MSTRRIKLVFVLAALVFAGSLAACYVWLDNKILAEEIAMRVGRETKMETEYRERHEAAAGKFRALTLFGFVMSAGIVTAGVISRRRARRYPVQLASSRVSTS